MSIAGAAMLVAAGLGNTAQAGMLGGVGGALGGALGGVADTVGGVAEGVGSALGGAGHHSSSTGSGLSAGVSADVSAGGSKTGGIDVSADVNAKVGKVIKTGICANVSVGGSGGAGCGAQARQTMPETPTKPSKPVVTRNNPDIDAIMPSGSESRTRAGQMDANWLVGLVAYGSDNQPLGMITRVRSDASNGKLPTITVQLDGKRSVQLRNAIAEIRPEGVWLVVPAGTVQSRASGRMTKLAIAG